VTGALTQNKHLRAALEGQWGFYGSPPHRSAFGVLSAWMLRGPEDGPARRPPGSEPGSTVRARFQEDPRLVTVRSVSRVLDENYVGLPLSPLLAEGKSQL